MLRSRIETDPELGLKQRRQWLSTVNRYGRCLELNPDLSPVSFNANRDRLKTFSPARHGLTPKSWSNLRSEMRTVFRRYGVPVAPRPRPADLDPAWAVLRERATADVRFSRGLSALFYYASRRGIAPEAVDDAAMAGFCRHLVDESDETEPHRKFQILVALWNKAVDQVPGWPPRRLTPVSFRDRVSVDESLFPESLRSEIVEWRAALAGERLLDDRAPDNPLRAGTVATKAEQLRRYLGALARSGAVTPDRITSLAVALQPRHFEAAITWYLRRNAPDNPDPRRASSPGLQELADTMLAIARHWCRLDKEDLKLLAKAVKKVRCRRKGMTSKNMDRLRPLLDSAVQMKLLLLPTRLREEARAALNPKKAALLCQTALAIELLLIAPMRLGNLLRLELDVHVLYSLPNRRGQARIVLEPHEVKNATRQDFPVKDEPLRLLDLYVRRYLPLLTPVGQPGTKLFPGEIDGHKHEVTLRLQITEAIRRYVGLEMNPHLFRHFAAALILQRNPEAFPTVSYFLGHRSLQTAKDFYIAFVGAFVAEFFYDEVLSPKRGGPGGPRRPGGTPRPGGPRGGKRRR
jgi:integrase